METDFEIIDESGDPEEEEEKVEARVKHLLLFLAYQKGFRS